MYRAVTTLRNEVAVNAPLERVWATLTNLSRLADYDPTVASSELTTSEPTGVGAARTVTMRDGKHWFKERVCTFEPRVALAFELTSCNFPIRSLSHSYSFSESNGTTTVTQVMTYEPKFGLLGKTIDRVAMKRQSDRGIKKFFAGLKDHVEAE